MEEMTPEMFGAIVAIGLVCFAVVTIYQERDIIGGWFRALADRYVVVKPSSQAGAHYDNDDSDGDEDADDAFFPRGKAETENPGETETTRNAPAPAPAVDVKALRDDGIAYAIGAALAHGLYKDASRTAAIRAAFGDVTGERYSRVARAVRHYEAAIAATLPPVDEPAPTARGPIPIAGGAGGYVARDDPAPPRR